MASDNSSLGSGVAEDAAIGGYEALPEQLRRMKGESDITSQSGDPNQLMQQEKQLQDSEYAGAAGMLRYGVRKFYGEFFSREDPDLAEQQYEQAAQASQAADQVANDKTFSSQGFKSQAEANAFAEHLRQSASAIHKNDPVKKEQLLGEAAAADEAGKQDQDALQKELQRTNAQASALNSTQHGGLGPNAEDLAGKLADTAKRLGDAATKLDKLVSNAKTPTVLKD